MCTRECHVRTLKDNNGNGCNTNQGAKPNQRHSRARNCRGCRRALCGHVRRGCRCSCCRCGCCLRDSGSRYLSPARYMYSSPTRPMLAPCVHIVFFLHTTTPQRPYMSPRCRSTRAPVSPNGLRRRSHHHLWGWRRAEKGQRRMGEQRRL